MPDLDNLKIKETDVFDCFIYCGGKCGSRTLNDTFINNGYKSIHLHGNEYYKKKYGMKNSIFDVIDNSCKNKKIYIIDCYRTPIERKISSFFQNIKQVHIPNYADLTLNEIITFFNDKLVNSLEEYHSINEVMNHYNIPLWDKFDTNKGYNLIEKDNKVFIKILFNDIEKWDKLLSNILGKKITIFNDNLTENKNIYELYKQFKNNYKVPKSYINNVLSNDKHFKIYNTENEQNIYIKKWFNNSI